MGLCRESEKVEMTVDSELVYHAGDLVGYSKHGRALFLPGGGAPRDGEVVAADDDDDLNPDAPGEDDEPDDSPPPAAPTRPSYKQLLEDNKKLQAGNARNNQELAKRRRVAQWMEKHGIADLDEWLAENRIDKETGQPLEGTGKVSGSPTEPPAAPPAAPNNPPAPEGNGKPPEPDSAEIERRVRLELEKRGAQADEQVERLTLSLKNTAIEAGLTKAQFVGTVATAMRVIDMSKVEIDESGVVTGVDDAVQALRAEIPEWFRRRTPSGPPPPRDGGSVDGGEKGKPRPKAKSWADQVVDRWQAGR